MSTSSTVNKKGRLIVLEGIDGAGKTTQAALLQAYLEAKGRKVYRTAEPTPLPSGVALREALGGKVKKTECQMAVMFVEDRIVHNQHPTEGIEAILASGADVLCDRYYYSTLAYQGHSTDYEWVKSMNLSCPEIRKPDLCIFLDLAPEKSLERISKNRLVKEIYEEKDRLEKFRKRYFDIFEMLKFTDNIAVLDTDRDIESISDDIYNLVANLEIKD